MAYLPDEENEEQKQQAATSGPVLANAQQAPQQATSEKAGSTGKPSASGSFTNLQRYVDANAGNENKMAEQVQTSIKTDADAATKAGGDMKTKATGLVDAGTVRDSKNYTGGYANQTWTAAPQPAAPAAPAKPVGDVSKITQDEFTRLHDGKYNGPQNLQDQDLDGSGQVRGMYEGVERAGKMAGGSMADQGELLKGVYAKDGKQYSRGENLLDTYIVGATGALQPTHDAYSNFTGGYDEIASWMGGAVKDAETTSAATGQAFNNAVAGSTKRAQDAYAAGETAAENTNKVSADYLARIGSDNRFAIDEAQKAGYGPEVTRAISLGQIDPTTLFTSTKQTATSGMSANAENDYNSIMNLLLGMGDTSASTVDWDPAVAGSHGAGNITSGNAAGNQALDDWTAEKFDRYAYRVDERPFDAELMREILPRSEAGKWGRMGDPYNNAAAFYGQAADLGIDPKDYLVRDSSMPNGIRLDTEGLGAAIKAGRPDPAVAKAKPKLGDLVPAPEFINLNSMVDGTIDEEKKTSGKAPGSQWVM
jgi:hypothetical protein